jgi:hypothetical protein
LEIGLANFSLCCPGTVNPLISASWVAGITGRSSVFFIYFFARQMVYHLSHISSPFWL